MNVIFDWFNQIKGRKQIDINKLPSQGIFYNTDFKLWIKKVNIQDVLEYESLYTNDITIVLSLIKKIVQRYTTLPKNYLFDDIKSVDIIFIFLEIVRWTTNKSLTVEYYNDITGAVEIIEFTPENFHYFMIPQTSFSTESKEFVIDGYRFSIPSIGIETSVTQFLIEKSYATDADRYNHYEYNFMYFLGNKKRLTFNEIDNLIEIFNNDLSIEEKDKINNIISKFRGFAKYTLKDGNRLIDINNRI